MPKRSVGGRARRAAQRCWAEAGTTRGSSPGGPRRCRGARQEGPARGRSAMLSDAPGTCAARAAGARERALLFYCCLFGNMLGAEKKGKEKLGGSCPRSQGKGQTDCHTAPGISRHSVLPPSLASKTRMGFTGHQPRKASLLGIASRRSRPGAPTGSRACSGLQVPVWDQLLEPRPVPVGLSCCQAGVGCAGEEAAGPRTAVLPEGTRATVRHPAGSAGREGTRRHTCVFVNTYECVFMRM